jgi:hypothetical protein
MSLWGYHNSPKWGDFLVFVQVLILSSIDLNLPISLQRTDFLKSHQRVGPHDYGLLCVVFGTLLGNSYAERRGPSTRICFQQENKNVEYLEWLLT